MVDKNEGAGWSEVEVGGTFVPWKTVGQIQQGELLAIEKSTKYKGEGYVARLRPVDMKTGEIGDVIAFSCPTLLRQAIEDGGLIGRTVRITYKGEREGTDIKEFRVQVKDA